MDPTTIFGVLGDITAFIVFLLPALMINNIRLVPEGRSLAPYRSVPYQFHAVIISCGLWIMYGGIYHDKFLVIINNTGLIMHIFYLALFIQYSRTCMGMMQNCFEHFAMVIVELLSLYILARLALTFLDPAKFAGTVCAAGTTFICVMKVLCEPKRTQSVYESAASFTNGVIWTVYALVSSDLFILVPNLVGCVLGLVQLVTYAIRNRSGQTTEEISPVLRTGQTDLPELEL